MMHKNDCLIGQNAACQRSLRSLNTSFELIFQLSLLIKYNSMIKYMYGNGRDVEIFNGF